MAQTQLNTSCSKSYQKFLSIKKLPSYRFFGSTGEYPDAYASLIEDGAKHNAKNSYKPYDYCKDYQSDIVKMAFDKGKFAVFADCGLGKTVIELEYARHCCELLPPDKKVLIITPLMVVPQMIQESKKFYGSILGIGQVRAKHLQSWLNSSDGPKIGITNYDALKDSVSQGNLGALILDESSMLKSHYGSWSSHCIRLGKGLKYKLACTGTPAPNDRIEYANHAVFLDAFPTVNSFLAKYFVNRGQTDNRWELKPHALEPFYRSLSHWSIFLTNPSTYGWKLDTGTIPPIHVHEHHVKLTKHQAELAYEQTGELFSDKIGGITSRSVLSQIAKGSHKGKPIESNKPQAIKELVESWPEESTIIWCKYNAEQDIISKALPEAGSIDGSTKEEDRIDIIERFKSGELKTIISKPKILGFGLNLQVATRQIFSGLQDSYEEYYQAVKRSNRIGSTKPLNVHIPLTDIERPMFETVVRKAKMVESDTKYQEQLFRKVASDYIVNR